jgi:redox-sensitive bicupin YhaK (pirin superfamily)
MDPMVIRAHERGHAFFGWLDSYHTFSFGNYMNPDRMNFGALRVLNDDTVAPGEGFGTHPHHNMEIISIPLEGTMMHRDSMGSEQALHVGNVQVMSAGSGLTHSEYNGSATDALKFLQIWIVPHTRNVEPRYDEVNVGTLTPNVEHTIIAPHGHAGAMWIHQDAWLSLADLTEGASLQREQRAPGVGTFVMPIEGSLLVNNTQLARRDAIGLYDASTVTIHAQSAARVLIIDVPVVLA